MDEPFFVNLERVEPVSANVGSPVLDSSETMAELTVSANDNPYGEVEFLPLSFSVSVDESIPGFLTVIRNFGTSGMELCICIL